MGTSAKPGCRGRNEGFNAGLAHLPKGVGRSDRQRDLQIRQCAGTVNTRAGALTYLEIPLSIRSSYPLWQMGKTSVETLIPPTATRLCRSAHSWSFSDKSDCAA